LTGFAGRGCARDAGVSFRREAAEHAPSLDRVCPRESNGKAPKSDSCDVGGKYIADADADADANDYDNGEISRAQSRSRFDFSV